MRRHAPSAGSISLFINTLSRRKLVAKRTTRRASHDRLTAIEADLAFAHRCDVEIRLAYQQRAEFAFVQRAEEFGEAAVRHVDFQHLIVMRRTSKSTSLPETSAQTLCIVAHLRLGLPSMASPIAANNCLDQSR